MSRYSGTAGSFSYFDGVIILPDGNVYVRLVRNFANNSDQGIIVGGDGAFKGITGSISRVSGTLFQVTVP